MKGLVLSLFPGLGLLDVGFIEEGWTVVRGPDIVYGKLHDIRDFHPPAGVFRGVIGGPPCQAHSRLAAIVRHRWGRIADDLIPEFIRCVREAAPEWFLMENVPNAPNPNLPEYTVHSFLMNNRWLADGTPQNRLRRFWFGVRGKQRIDLRRWIDYTPLEPAEFERAVLANGQLRKGRLNKKMNVSSDLVRKSLRLQGLPEDFLDGVPLTVAGKQRLIGNAVPLPMSRAVAKAISCFMVARNEECEGLSSCERATLRG